MALAVLLALSAALGAAEARSSTFMLLGNGGGDVVAPSCDVQLVAPSLLQRRSSVQRIGGELALEQEERCLPFQSWPAVDNNVICGSCRALVKAQPFEYRCDKYCESFGHVCVAAAEEVNENCEVKYSQHCDEPFSGTSDILCTCMLPRPVEEQPVDVMCDRFDQWPDVDGGVTCGSCQALILSASYGNRCDRYCESFGHVCVGAAEEHAESCQVKSEYRCDETIPDTSDILCTCSLPTNDPHEPSSSSSSPSTTEEPVDPDIQVKEESLTCKPFAQWPSVRSETTCGNCTALVLAVPYGGRCDKFCESFGHVCVGAAEEVQNTCTALYTSPCDVEIVETADILCTCRLPTDNSTSPDEAPTAASTTSVPPAGTTATTTMAEATTATIMTTVSPVEPTTMCDRFDQWPDVDGGVTCGSCQALILSASYGNRCDRYCESFGHVCVGAAEEHAESCQVKSEYRCDETIPGTSDILCTCSLPTNDPHEPSSSSSSPSTTEAPIDPDIQVKEESLTCKPFAQWPSVRSETVCGNCTALVLAVPYRGRCDKFCESFGHVCVGAAEEVQNTCTALYTSPCDVEIVETADILCTCRLPTDNATSPDEAPTAASTTSAPAAGTTATTTMAEATTTTIMTTVSPVEPTTTCDRFDLWPDVDGGVTCGSCQALILSPSYGNRCDRYCESFGHVCVGAAEEHAESCQVKSEYRCDETIPGTSDILCTCSLPTNDPHEPSSSSTTSVPPAGTTATTTSAEATTTTIMTTVSPVEPTTLECCAPYRVWPSVDNHVTCGDSCMALVETAPYGGRCDKYCESFGHVCVAAAEELHEDCSVLYMADCDREIVDTTDMLCTCQLPISAETCPDSAISVTPAPVSLEPSTTRIEVKGRQLLVHGKPLHLKGVAWHPVNKGDHRVEFRGNVERDAKIMAEAGINAVRTYSTITDWEVLDTLWSHGIWVINSVFNHGRSDTSHIKHMVDAVKDHPAILMWSIGNEWNYNGLYVGMRFWDSVAKLKQVSEIIKQRDTMHPIACIYGELGGLQDAAAHLTSVDVWGINVYRGISFGNLFDKYAGLTSKPMFLGEYGADAWNALINRQDLQSQADATKQLTEEIARHSSITGGPCIGGFAFEFADEWWKDSAGRRDRHDVGGSAPGGGPHPDKSFNEEWWGLLDIDRRPRPALFALRDVALPSLRAV